MNSFYRAQIQEMAAALRFSEPVYVTRPNLPPLAQVAHLLETAWEKQWITNDGDLHARLESELTRVLEVPHVNLFCNGTIALLAALKALSLKPGNVITTAFTFPATVNTLYWNRLEPVFCDIQPETYNIDPEKIESLISSETRAILPVHVYGTPCAVEQIQEIADRHHLPVIYDAAHAFGVRYRGKSVLSYGTLSMLSFHATKIFTTAEGGALVTADPKLDRATRLLKNFGIIDEETVELPGINGKLSELHAALGLAQIEDLENHRAKRKDIAELYCERLGRQPGIRCLAIPPGVEHNYAYFPIRIDQHAYGMGRDALYMAMREFNIFSRKYFYPLCSTHPWCRLEEGSLPVSEAAAREVLCLPLYSTLSLAWTDAICAIIGSLGDLARGGSR